MTTKDPQDSRELRDAQTGVSRREFFRNQADVAKLKPLMGSVNAPGAAEKNAVA